MTSARVKPHDRVLVIGKTGSGKSNKAKALVSAELEHGARVLAFDPLDEWSRHGRKSDHRRLGPLRDRCTVDDLMREPEILDANDLSLAVVPSQARRECAEDFVQVAALVKDTGNVLLTVEEVGFFGDRCEESLIEAACTFRHYGVGMVFVAQCAIQIPKMARRQASQIWSGRQDDPEDLSALAKVAGAEFAEAVSRLPRGELLHWRDDFSEGRAK
ncbi:MAG: helicase HerA domain-containing protein [Myxococcota bacterium]